MTQPVRPTADIRRRLLAGEHLTTAGTAADYGCSTSLLNAVASTLRREGVTVEMQRAHATAPGEFFVTHPTPTGGQLGPARGVQKMAGRGQGTAYAKRATPEPVKPSPPAKRAKRNGVAPPMPAIGAELRVCLLAVDDDGRVSIGLRSDAGTWLLSVEGFSAPESSGA